MAGYPHTSWNDAETRARSHQTNVANLHKVCPVEQSRDYCPVCCAVITDTPAKEPRGG